MLYVGYLIVLQPHLKNVSGVRTFLPSFPCGLRPRT